MMSPRSRLLFPPSSAAEAQDRVCAFYDHLQKPGEQHAGSEGSRGNATLQCARGSSCYSMWEKTSNGEFSLVKQGIAACAHGSCSAGLTLPPVWGSI